MKNFPTITMQHSDVPTLAAIIRCVGVETEIVYNSQRIQARPAANGGYLIITIGTHEYVATKDKVMEVLDNYF